MTYSNKLKSDFKTLAREKFEKTLSHCKTPQEIDSLCTTLYLALYNEISRDQVKHFLNEIKEKFDNLPNNIEIISNLLELASVEGFELYATEGVIDLVNVEHDGTSSNAPLIRVPAFTSDKKSRNEKIQEAKNEFIVILCEELYLQLGKAFSLFDEQKLEKIQEQQKNNLRVSKNQTEMATRQSPQEGSEAHVESEEETLSRIDSGFLEYVQNLNSNSQEPQHSSAAREHRVLYSQLSRQDLLQGNSSALQFFRLRQSTNQLNINEVENSSERSLDSHFMP